MNYYNPNPFFQATASACGSARRANLSCQVPNQQRLGNPTSSMRMTDHQLLAPPCRQRMHRHTLQCGHIFHTGFRNCSVKCFFPRPGPMAPPFNCPICHQEPSGPVDATPCTTNQQQTTRALSPPPQMEESRTTARTIQPETAFPESRQATRTPHSQARSSDRLTPVKIPTEAAARRIQTRLRQTYWQLYPSETRHQEWVRRDQENRRRQEEPSHEEEQEQESTTATITAPASNEPRSAFATLEIDELLTLADNSHDDRSMPRLPPQHRNYTRTRTRNRNRNGNRSTHCPTITTTTKPPNLLFASFRFPKADEATGIQRRRSRSSNNDDNISPHTRRFTGT
ncbi:MAG: hypothetical protein M1834_000591 [Cirrosporium novae-zelandiae]|nr:MAG: hypothetical protein M1834_000591 [Cirrosporium novae-zelandiae]